MVKVQTLLLRNRRETEVLETELALIESFEMLPHQSLSLLRELSQAAHHVTKGPSSLDLKEARIEAGYISERACMLIRNGQDLYESWRYPSF